MPRAWFVRHILKPLNLECFTKKIQPCVKECGKAST